MKPIVRTNLEQIRQEEQSKEQLIDGVAQLQASNATLTYELMMANAENADLRAQHSGLVYDLMQKGVL